MESKKIKYFNMPRVDKKLALLLIRLKIYATQILRRYQPGVRKRRSIAWRQPRTWLISGIIDGGDSRVWQHDNFTLIFNSFTFNVFSGYSAGAYVVGSFIDSSNTHDVHHHRFHSQKITSSRSTAIVNSRFNLEKSFSRFSVNGSHDWAITLWHMQADKADPLNDYRC